jgi:hypothetical protein
MKEYPLKGWAAIAILYSLNCSAIAQPRWGEQHGNQGQAPQQAQQQAQQQRAQQEAQQAQQRNAQEQAQRAQQGQQQQAQRAQQQAQEMQQRNAQQQAQRAQQAQQEMQQRNVQQAQRAQQAQQRSAEEQAQRAQQSQQRSSQEQAQRDQRNAQRDAQRVQQRNDQQQFQRQQSDQAQKLQQRQANQAQKFQQQGHGLDRIQNRINTQDFDKNTIRPNMPPALRVPPVPLQKAFPMPNFAAHASPDQMNRARMAQLNMTKHLRAVPINQAPRNYARLRTAQLNNYYNNPMFINNRRYNINRQNTFYYPVQPNYYPSWYQPNPNWIFSNGFTLCNAINVGASWLGYGWQPYYGEPPVGFICASDFIPTPWVYDVASGQWRQPGLYSDVSGGPPYDYTGPITVEVIEPVAAPNGQFVNVPYLYDAFYYPEAGRWGYENQQGYFIWVDF